MRGDRFDDPRSVQPLAIGLVVVGTLSVPLVVVSAISGHLPTRGALLAAAILFATVWAASTIHVRPVRISGSGPKVCSPDLSRR